jgi:hypothetical protein
MPLIKFPRSANLLAKCFLALKTKAEVVEKPVSQRLMENVHMQGFRNPEE